MQARGFRYRSASSHLMGLDALYLSNKLVASGVSKLHPCPYSNAISKIQGVGGEDFPRRTLTTAYLHKTGRTHLPLVPLAVLFSALQRPF
jgi:hypothetical protein